MRSHKPSKNKLKKYAQWRQRLRNMVQETRSRVKARYEQWHQRQIHYAELPEEKQTESKRVERITMLTAIRILLAELGETEYWRTTWHLIWRPGYVIADYLNGKRRQYLHPFQLLLATTLLLGLAVYIVPAKAVPNVTYAADFEYALQKEADSEPLTTEQMALYHKVISGLDVYRQWYGRHLEFGLLIGSIMVVLFTWLLFRKSPRNEFNGYNLAEILTAQIFIIAQLQTVSTVWILVTGWFVPTLTFRPYAFPNVIASLIVFVDYQQLFGRKWYSTLWRTLFCVIW